MAENYQYRETYRGSRKVAADVVANELERLRANGDLTAQRVVDAARPFDAPLHDIFEWDVDRALQEYNLILARQLIRAVVVIPANAAKGETETCSYYVHVPERDRGEGKYIPLNLVVEDVDEYERALGEAQRYLESAERRFHELRRLAETKGGKTEALAIAIQGFTAVKEALALLRD